MEETRIYENDDCIFEHWYKYGLTHREIYVEDISTESLQLMILPLLKMAEENNNPIKIYINSYGGSAFEGLVFCNIIDTITCPVTIEILGYAYSASCLIAMAGKNNPNVKTVCHKYSTGLIHAGSVGYSGDARKAKDVSRFHDRIDDELKAYVLSHSNITDEMYENHIDQEWYLLANDMLSLGIVDEII